MTGRRGTSDGVGRRDTPTGDESRWEGLRGQTEVLSVALLLAITVTGTGLVVAFGSSALSDSQRASEVGSAEHAMTQFDSKASLVGLGTSSAQTMSLGSDGTTRVHEDRGWMRVRVVNRTDGTTEHVVMNDTLGAVVYSNGDTRVAYQGGGVWKRTGGGATMVSPPEFHYRGTTLTLPLVSVNGSGTLDGTVRMTRDAPTNSTFPRPGDAELRNPLEDGEVNVTVHSDYYEAWGRFFEDRTGGNVSYDDDRERVTITLVVPGNTRNVTNALAGTTPDRMTIKGAGGSSFTDSYNSSDGPYSEADRTENGTIVTKGGVELTGGAEIFGDLRTGGGTVDVGGGVAVHGNVSYGGTLDCGGGGPGGGPGGGGGGGDCGAVDGWTANNGTAPDLNPIGDVVDGRIETYADPSNNRNDEVSAIDGEAFNDSESTLTLPSAPDAGSAYYLSDATLDSSQTLAFDTSEGDVVLAVDDDVVWTDVNVEVTHPDRGEVRIYTSASTFRVTGGSVGDTIDHRSPSLRVYAGPGLDFALDEDATFVGLVYAPGTDSASGSITVRTQSELYGGIVGGGTALLQSGGSIHFDQALRSVDPQADVGEDFPQLTYLHVSVSHVNVTSA
ncbi:DUF7289 family protein [Halorussus litoreus]|uniref:DUF7289 family protein n=1 Tax=Halorussus litoreus TaxID=1710536 RepID=UPI001300B355|nr:hypothetical protein [Halorussus litoreus]